MKSIEIRRVRTGRRVQTWVYRAYRDNKPIRYRGNMISRDSRQSVIEALKRYDIQ